MRGDQVIDAIELAVSAMRGVVGRILLRLAKRVLPEGVRLGDRQV